MQIYYMVGALYIKVKSDQKHMKTEGGEPRKETRSIQNKHESG